MKKNAVRTFNDPPKRKAWNRGRGGRAQKIQTRCLPRVAEILVRYVQLDFFWVDNRSSLIKFNYIQCE
jgi:hypothetical protein